MAWSSTMTAAGTTVTPRRRPRTRRVRSIVVQPVAKKVRAYLALSNIRHPKKTPRRAGTRSRILIPTWPRRYTTSGRGLWRVYSDAEYRFYRRDGEPPRLTDAAFAVNATLPHTPTETFSDGEWYIGVRYFDGNLLSGFLPLGENGEPWLKLNIVGGVEDPLPPQSPNNWHLEARAAGVVRVHGTYKEFGSLRATEWAMVYTISSAGFPVIPLLIEPITPTATVAMPTRGLAVLSYDLPAGSSGDVVRLYLLTRRPDGVGGWVYSAHLGFKTLSVDTSAGGAETTPPGGDRWTGRIPER